MNLPEKFKIVSGTGPVTTSGGVICDYISLKNAVKVWVVAKLKQAVAHATSLSINVATAIAPTGATAMTAEVPIWLNDDCEAGDALTRQTDAANQAVAATAKVKMLVMEIDPAKLPAGYDCIAAVLSDSTQATNFANIDYYIETRYPQATPPAAITD